MTAMNLAFGTSAKKDAATILAVEPLGRAQARGLWWCRIKGRSIYGAQIRYRICDDFVTHFLSPTQPHPANECGSGCRILQTGSVNAGDRPTPYDTNKCPVDTPLTAFSW